MEELYSVFAQTLSEQKSEREAAEQRLSELYKQEPLFLIYLLQFATSPLETIVSGGAVATLSSQPTKMSLHVQLAAAIHFRNIISKCNWNRRAEVSSRVREEIHQSIIQIQIEPHLHDKVRRQILSATDDLIAYDYPERWTSLLTQLTECINECLPHISLNDEMEHEQQIEQLKEHCSLCLVALQRLKHCLSVLRYVCKSYEKVEHCNLHDINTFCDVYLPSLLQIMSPLFLQKLWEKELKCLHEQQVETTSNNTPHVLEEENVLSASSSPPMLVETSHCMRLVLKCIWSLSVVRLPKVLINNASFNAFWQYCIRGPLQSALIYLLPWSFRQLQVLEHTQFTTSNNSTICRNSCSNNNNVQSVANSYISYEEHFVSFQHSPMWRVLKWCLVLSNRCMQQLINLTPRHVKRKDKSLSQHVEQEQYALQHASICLEFIRWHCTSHCVTSKAYILAIQNCISLLHHKMCYSQLMEPHMEELLTRLILPRLCISHEEIELWQNNPMEYIQRQRSPIGDLYSAKVNSSEFMLALLAKTTQNSNKDVESNLITCLYNYIEQQMEIHLPLALEATDDDFHCVGCNDYSLQLQTHSSSSRMKVAAARCVDACLYCLYKLKKIVCGQFSLYVRYRKKNNIKKSDDNQGHIEPCLILPRLESFVNKFLVLIIQHAKLGILRARAVLVLSAYAMAIHWTNEDQFRSVLGCTLALLNDPDEAVQLETCTVFSSLIGHELARPVITPNIGPLVGQYFRIMRLVNNDGVIHTLRKTITLYKDSLLQWAVQLAEMLVEQFNCTYHDILQRHLIDNNTSNNSKNKEIICSKEEKNKVSYQSNINSVCVSDEELVEALSAADELLETFITIIKALPASGLTRCLRIDYILNNITINNNNSTPAELQPEPTRNDVINDVFMCIQERLGTMLVTLLSQQTESSYEFIDGVLRLAVLLISRSVGVHTSMWALLPSLYCLIINGAMDYFAEMIPVLEAFLHAAPFDFMFTPLYILCSQSADNVVKVPTNNIYSCNTAQSSSNMITSINKDVNANSDGNVNVMSCTPAELMLKMCVVVLHSTSLCTREVAGVPMLLSNLITCYWDMTQNTSVTLRHYHLTCTSHSNNLHMQLQIQCIPSASVLLEKILSEVLAVAAHRPGQSNVFRLLLSNVLLTSMIADAPTTLRLLSSLHTLTSFFEHYVQLCMPVNEEDDDNINEKDSHENVDSKWDPVHLIANTHNKVKPALFQYLRSYDRTLFVMAFIKMLECVCNTITTTHTQIETWLEEAMNVLCTVWHSGLINAYAQCEVEQSVSECKLHKKSILKLTNQKSTKDNVNDSHSCKDEYDDSNDDSEEWEDEEDSEEESEESEEWEDEEEEMDSDDDNSSDLYDDLNDSEEGKYQELLLQTEAARSGNKHNNESKYRYKKSEDDFIDEDEDEDEDDIDNELLHDTDATLLCSPIMRQNAWAELQRTVLEQCQHVQSLQQCNTMMFHESMLHLLTSMHHQCLDQGLVSSNASTHINIVAEAAKSVNELRAFRAKHT